MESLFVLVTFFANVAVISFGYSYTKNFLLEEANQRKKNMVMLQLEIQLLNKKLKELRG